MIGFRNDPLSYLQGPGGSEVVSMPDACLKLGTSKHLFHSSSDCMPGKFSGAVRSNYPPGVHATIYPGVRHRECAMVTLPCGVLLWSPGNTRVACGGYKRGAYLAFSSVQQSEPPRPFQLLIFRCLSVYPPVLTQSFLHPENN